MIELADGEAPHEKEEVDEMQELIVNGDAPKIQNTKWSAQFKDFVHYCVKKNPDHRWPAEKLLEHPWLRDAQGNQEAFVQVVKEWWEEPDLTSGDC